MLAATSAGVAMARSRVEITGAAAADGRARGRIDVAFTVLARRAEDVAEIAVAVAHDAGVLELRQPPPVMTRGTGRGTAAVDARALPGGRAMVRIAALDARGRRGDAGELPIAIPATGADAGLRIVTWEALDAEVARPGARSVATPRFHLVWEGSGAAVAHLAIARPAGAVQQGALAAPAGGAGIMTPLALDPRAQEGEYAVTVRLVGEDGAMSAPSTATVRLGARGAAAPRVDGTRWRGAGGDLVVRGAALDGPELTVLLDGAPAPVAEVAAERLLVHAADLVDPATLEVRTALGTARARGAVRPRATLTILPAEPVAAEGEEVRLQALVRGSRDGAVAWSVPGDPPGVAIDADGTLRVGHGAPEAVTVRAASVAEPRVASEVTVRVVAPHGGGEALGARGGTVISPDGRAALTLPEGALAGPAAIEVRPRAARAAGRRGEVVAAEVSLTPTALDAGAELVVALETHATPGSVMRVQAEERGRWREIGEAVVDAHGMHAVVGLERLPQKIRLIPDVSRVLDLLPVELSAPVITAVEGSPPVEEGATVAVLVTGGNFVPGATWVQARVGGAVDGRLQAWGAAVTRDGTRLATTIRVDEIPELPGSPPGVPGVLSNHVLRVTTPAGFAEVAFPILGRDEIRVRAGEVATVSASVRLSRLDIDQGGRLDVASTVPPVTIDVLGEARVWGDVRVVAADGAAGGIPPSNVAGGPGGAGGAGAAPFNAGGGGAGGTGALIGVGPPAITNGATGASGLGAAPGTLGVGGAGGLGSPSAGWGPLPHGTDDGMPGKSPPDPHVIGTGVSSYPPGFAPGAGGGGGGGGGGEGLISPGRPGGGGGGGGAGGGAVRIAAGRELWTYGNVLARGGDGGRGGRGQGDWYSGAGHGGSGGGGAGGSIHLAGLSRGGGAVAATSGSTPRAISAGVGIEARTPLQIALGSPATGEVRIDGYAFGSCRPAPTPGPDLFPSDNLVATVPSWEVRGLDANFLSVRNGEDEELHAVRPEHVFPQPFTSRNSFFVRTVPLQPGFNYIRAQRRLEDEPYPIAANPLLMECADVRVRRVLYLPDTIAAYEFTATLAPASLTVPAERSATITAAVTASQPTGIMWTVDGGDPYGTIVPAGGGARYTAPSRPPPGGAWVRAASSLDPGRYVRADVTVLPGIRIASTAATGTPAVAGLPSANAGQSIDVTIPPEVSAITGTGFVNAQVVLETLRPGAAGGCERGVLTVPATVAPGLASLSATLPACTSPRGWVRVPGHGSAELQVVPAITAFEGDRASEPDVVIRGTGFACGETDVLVNGAPVAAGRILAVTCGSVRLRDWPDPMDDVQVRTVGGVSAAARVP